MFPEDKKYNIKLFSKNRATSPVLDYLSKLTISNPRMARKAISSIKLLNIKIQTHHDIEIIQNVSISLFELRVQSGNDICRFFFVIEEPEIIVLYGFTKKSQKTKVKDINAGIEAFNKYQENKHSINFDI